MKPLLKGIFSCILMDINTVTNDIIHYSDSITILLNLVIASITIFKMFHKKKSKKHDKYIIK